MSPLYRELLSAGYSPLQIISCPWNDVRVGEQCPCQTQGPRPRGFCGLGRGPSTVKGDA